MARFPYTFPFTFTDDTAGFPYTFPFTFTDEAGFPYTFDFKFPNDKAAGSLTATATATGGLRRNTHQTIGGTLVVNAARSGAATRRGEPHAAPVTGTLPVSAAAAGSLVLGRVNPPGFTVTAARRGLPANQLLDTDHVVALRTISGVTLQQFGPRDYITLKWSRELRDVSSCDMTLPPLLDMSDRLPEIMPWLHWLSVYSAKTRTLLWDGPIQKLSSTRESATITAKDIGALMTRTRTPLTKRWDSQDVSVPAGELWNAMIALHNLPTELITRPDPQNGRFDFDARADEKTMDGPIGDLVNLGLRWTVVAGVPIIGPASRHPVAELGEADFVGGSPELIRDGSQFFNDVLLRGPDSLARTRVERHGLNLQTIVDVDSVFGVSNAERATGTYARYVSDVRDSVGIFDGAALHPDAPVSLDDLIPSVRFTLTAYGMRTKQELESMSVMLSAGKAQVGIKLESVVDKEDLPELSELVQKQGGAVPA